jgi:hypothetical protein
MHSVYDIQGQISLTVVLVRKELYPHQSEYLKEYERTCGDLLIQSLPDEHNTIRIVD